MTRAGIRLYDLLKRTHVQKTQRFLNESLDWELNKLLAHQEGKLKNLLSSASEDVPYYSEILKGKKVVDITLSEFEGYPTIDRRMVIEAGNRLLSNKINFKKCKVGRTGGTTGPPLRIYRDTETRSFALAAYYRFYSWMGIEPGMPEIEFWGSAQIQKLKPGIRNSIQNHFYNIHRFNSFLFNDEYLEGVVRKLIKIKPRLIRGYLSAIILLADYIERKNIKGINPIAVSSTSETLFPEYRKKIENVFQAPLFDQYGCGECNSIAFECNEHKGMHITMEHCILEQDPENRLLVTNLDNHSQPFIKYMNGDRGVICREPCSCGNAAPRILELKGRLNENIILKDGASVNGIFFSNLLDEYGFINSNKILRFQVVQDRIGEITFKVEVKTELNSADKKKLENTLTSFFNKVEISQHKFLDPGSGGKFQYLISNLTEKTAES